MYNTRSKGFTLIELLVVIAIIGILSAVVLASLNTARSKGSDAAIEANLNSIRTQAELEYSSQNPVNQYVSSPVNGSCPTTVIGSSMWDSTVVSALKQAMAQSPSVVCYASVGPAGSYAISAALVSQLGKYYCIDSKGTGGIVNGPATSVVCPALP